MLVLLASAQDSMLAIGMFMLEYFMKQECWQLAEELFAKTSMVWSCVSVRDSHVTILHGMHGGKMRWGIQSYLSCLSVWLRRVTGRAECSVLRHNHCDNARHLQKDDRPLVASH